MAISEDRPRTPLYVLRTMTESIARIVARHAERSPQVTVPGTRLLDVARRFAASHDQVLHLDRINEGRKLDSRERCNELSASAADWGVVFAYDITGYDPEDWKPLRTTDDEVIRAARQMHHDISVAHAANPIEGADAALADLDAHIQAASAALELLKDGLAEEQEQRSKTRELGIELAAKAVAYRRALGRIVGRRHRDYRALLLTRRTADATTTPDDSVEIPEPDLQDSADSSNVDDPSSNTDVSSDNLPATDEEVQATA